ncbi:MAG: HAD hydrolase-like protein, partial [Burkholderiales bacterium]
MQHKAIVFDLDGTLLNTIDDLAYSMNAVLQRAGFPVHNIDQYKLFVGNGLVKLVERSL